MENIKNIHEILPIPSDKDLQAMNQLMMDKRYRIKPPSNFLRPDRSEKVNPDFILYILNDYLGHLQNCVASTKKLLPFEENKKFYESLAQSESIAYKLIIIVRDIDIKKLSSMLLLLQKNPYETTIVQLVPFIKLFIKSLIRVYYLGSAEVTKKYKSVYAHIMRELVPMDPLSTKNHVSSAIEEWYYIFNQVFSGLYPLILRMCSPVMLTQNELFYANGSRVLAWLGVVPSEILIVKKGDEELREIETRITPQEVSETEIEAKEELPYEVQKGLEILERLFPEAGWDVLDTMPDLCPYFQPLLQFHDAFTQLAPDNPLQQTLIFHWILEELFQGLRLIKFVPFESVGFAEESEDIYKILEDWILYQETVFDKNFSADLKEYTHQIYTQPEYYKSPYGRTLLSNMYTLIKTVFLPYFNIRMFGTAKFQKDDRLPPFHLRVMRLKRLLTRYNSSIASVSAGGENFTAGSVDGVQNPWELYKFDISNSVSRRMNAICSGKNGVAKTNALLIQYTLSILHVLDWWINDSQSYAYVNTPDYLYRVVEPGSAVPAFGVKVRTDIEAIFIRHLKARGSGMGGEK